VSGLRERSTVAARTHLPPPASGGIPHGEPASGPSARHSPPPASPAAPAPPATAGPRRGRAAPAFATLTAACVVVVAESVLTIGHWSGLNATPWHSKSETFSRRSYVAMCTEWSDDVTPRSRSRSFDEDRSAPTTAKEGRAAYTPAIPCCPAASSPCRRRVPRPRHGARNQIRRRDSTSSRAYFASGLSALCSITRNLSSPDAARLDGWRTSSHRPGTEAMLHVYVAGHIHSVPLWWM
jgi:hypothetical protein